MMQSGPSRAGACARLAMGLLAAGLAWAAAAASPPASLAPVPSAKQAVVASPAKPVDINSASRTQLKSLPGIGDAEADRIVAGRPYLSKSDLATNKVLPAGVYLSLRNRIIAIQRDKPMGKA